MRFGCCVALASFVPPTSGAKQLDIRDAYEARIAAVPNAMTSLTNAGCDFAEFGVGMVAPDLPDAAFEAFRRVVADSPLAAECYNSFIPPDIRLVGPDRDPHRIERYVAVATERVAATGGKIIVFGSGGARRVPDGYPRESAEDELVDFLRVTAEHARRLGITIAIEPLNRSESNILNSVEESVALARRVDREEIRVLVDFYHLTLEEEPMSHIVDAGECLAHVHVADTGRLYPGSGSYPYPDFYAALRDARYDARISVECNWRDYDHEVVAAMRFLRESYAASST
jgi:sugar phosphate isomerase/epimerase